MRQTLVVIAVMVGMLAAGPAAAVAAPAPDDPCHADHSCPSDDASYIWFEPSPTQTSSGWWCVDPQLTPSPYANPQPIDYGGRTYLCTSAGVAETVDLAPPHALCPECGASVDGYPPNSTLPGSAGPDPGAALRIRSWRTLRRGASVWERTEFHVCTTLSQGPFIVELHETFGDAEHVTEFRLSRAAGARVGRTACRNVVYRWRRERRLRGRGLHQLIVALDYPLDAPPPIGPTMGSPVRLADEIALET